MAKSKTDNEKQPAEQTAVKPDKPQTKEPSATQKRAVKSDVPKPENKTAEAKKTVKTETPVASETVKNEANPAPKPEKPKKADAAVAAADEAEQLSLEIPAATAEETATDAQTQSSYYEMEEEKQVGPLAELFKNIKNSIKNKEKDKKKKKKKFNPMPSVHATRYHPDPHVGLNEEQLNERYENDLINKVECKYSKSYKSIFFGNIFTFFNLLGLLCTIALIICRAPFSRFTFCFVYVLNIGAGIFQEIRAKLSIEKLSLLSSKSAKVIRNGVESEIPTGEIVLDDILRFTLGNQISTDSVVEEGNIEVNESLLTGESVSIKKKVGDPLYAGSFVTGGSCLARANKVGKENYIEVLSAKAKKYRKPHSELMRSTQLIISVVGFLIVPISIGMFFKMFTNTGTTWTEAINGTVAVVIGMIPAGMILLTSAALAWGAIKLAKNNTLVQDLYSLEMLARIDVLCLDKTGTITDGRMKVSDCIILNNNIPNTISEIMGSMLTALDDNNQTSIALNNHFGRNNALKPLKILPFNSARKLSAVTFADVGTYAYGAPEFVMKEVPDNVQRMIKQYASMGLRVLLLCYSKSNIIGENIPSTMKAIALITITDNIREDAASTIEWFKENGVQIKIISGDNPVTVSEVARRVGVENAHRYISLEGLSESDVINVANKYTVFGRVTPEQKAILIRAIKAAGHNTAMTGDGVNDILALKEANCAISVGSGSDAARNVSHIVLMDSNFSSMPKVVHEGRRVINNIQNSASLYLMKTFFITLLALFILAIPGTVYPFTTSNMMMLEMLIIGLASVFLSFQPNDKKVEGKFISYVITKSLPGALLMLISVLIIEIARQFLAPMYGFDDAVYQAMQIHVMNFAGAIMLFRICKPFNLFRGVLYSVVLVVLTALSVYSMAQGFAFLEIIKFPSFHEYWHHILIMVTIIIMDIPLSGWLDNIVSQFKNTGKNKKNLR